MLEQQFFSSVDETIIYSDQSSLINNGYPTLVNKKVMESIEISPKQFFMDGGVYEQAFLIILKKQNYQNLTLKH